MKKRWRGIAALALFLSAASGPSLAQDPVAGVIVSPILTLDQERLFEGSGVAARISAEVERQSRELAEENRRIEAELVAEELDLTERRPTLAADEFRALADAFDAKVQKLRNEQDAKQVELQRLRDEERQNFLRQILPIVAEILGERGGLIVIDRRAAILSADAVDITDEAIRRVNLALGNSGTVVPDRDDDVQPELLVTDPAADAKPEPDNALPNEPDVQP